MKYAKIVKYDITNGPGFRTVLFTQGCSHHCPGCFNPETWDLGGGKDFRKDEEDLVIALCKEEHCAGLSILGGEPLLERNLVALELLLKRFHEECPGKDVWLWTGYTLEELRSKAVNDVIDLCDVIIDGPFIKEKKDPSLFYAGSTNQRMWVRENDRLLLQCEMPKVKTQHADKH